MNRKLPYKETPRSVFFITLIQVILWFSLPLKGITQFKNYVFSHITTENGLLANEVSALCQDTYGYIWIGSQAGLQRYDGYRFVNFLTNLHDSGALHQSAISNIFEDSRHRLWIGGAGPYLFKRETGTFYNYNLHRRANAPLINGVSNFAEDKKGNIWVGWTDSYFRLNPVTNEFEDCRRHAGMEVKENASIMKADPMGNIWFVTNAGIRYYDPETNITYSKKNNPRGLKLLEQDGKGIFSFCFGKNDDVWYSYNESNKLYCYNFKKNELKQYTVRINKYAGSMYENFNSKVEGLFVTANGKTGYVLPGHGLGFLDPVTGVFEEVPLDNASVNGLHGNPDVFTGCTVIQDSDQNIWLSSNRGLNVFNPQRAQFHFYGTTGNYRGSFPALNVNGIIQDKVSGDYFAGYYFPSGGVIRFDSMFRIKKQYLIKNNGSGSVGVNQIWCLFQDANGIIWGPNQERSMMKIDPRSDRFTIEIDSALDDHINAMQDDEKGNTWVCTWRHGLMRKDKVTGIVSNYNSLPGGSKIQPRNISCLSFENDSIIWAGTNEAGFLKFDRRLNRFTAQYIFEEGQPNSISSNTVHSIAELNGDTLLLATHSGLNFFNRRTGVFTHISAKDGLPGDIVMSIQADKSRTLWAGCFGGFCKITLNPLRITRYGQGDGIMSGFIDRYSLMSPDNKRCIISSASGFFAFDPSAIIAEKAPVKPVVTGFRVFERTIHPDSVLLNHQRIKLSYKENSLTFEFSSLQYNTSDKLKYYYKLEGVDAGWMPASEEQAVRYHKLTNGSYVFKVKAQNRDGVYSVESDPLIIIILPPFWKTWWFRSLIFLLFSVLFLSLLHWQRKRRADKEQLKLEYERKIAAVEMNTLRAQMNPHFIFNSLNSIDTFILEKDDANASEYLQKFSNLVRLILDNSRNEWILLENELKALALYLELESLRFGHRFSYEIVIGKDVNTSAIWIPPLIIQPYVENAIRHGLINRKEPGGKVTTRVWKEGRQLHIQVEDNGIGRQAAEDLKSRINKLHQLSHGMNISAERLSIINHVYNVNASVTVTDLKNELNQPSGTVVLLTIEYRNNAINNNR